MAHKAYIHSGFQSHSVDFDDIVFDKNGVIFYLNTQVIAYAPSDRVITIEQDETLMPKVQEEPNPVGRPASGRGKNKNIV
jgi:hypothetical protein